MDKSIFENSTRVTISKEEKSNELMSDNSSKKVKDYFEDILDTFEGEERMNKNSGRPFSEFKEEYLKNRTKK